MIGYILAAGFGTRLKPITDTVPKALVPVRGEPLLAHNLRTLHNSGVISAIGVNSHYLHEQLVDFQKKSSIPFELFHEKDKIRGTGGALDFARGFLGGDDAFLIANVDILHKFDIAELSSRFMDEKRICSLVSIPVNGGGTILYDGGTGDFLGVSSDRDAVICQSSPPKDIRESEFTGVAFYRREFLDFVNADDFSVIPIWKRSAANGRTPGVIIPKEGSSWWMDVGTHEALRQIEADAADGRIVL